MCTALHLGDCFGRNLDLNCSYGEKVCIVPRNAPLAFRRMGTRRQHYAIIGMAVIAEGIPLFYDGANEKGLCMAGLNFPGNAFYPPEQPGKDNVPPFELISWILCQCATVTDARKLLENSNLAQIPFSDAVPLMPLHWMISDREQSLVVEATREGLTVRENPAGVLTNNPPFAFQLFNLNNYRAISAATPENHFSSELDLEVYCQGLGALGLPGDVSSMSRFVRAAFLGGNSVDDGYEISQVGQFFHLLGSVEMPRGCCCTDSGDWDITVYSSCIHAPSGRYYYTTYGNRQISCVDLRKTDLDGNALAVFELEKEQKIFYQNG